MNGQYGVAKEKSKVEFGIDGGVILKGLSILFGTGKNMMPFLFGSR
jgi:hypothetical protein